MNSSNATERHAWRVALMCAVVSGACMLLPEQLQSALRATTIDLLRPGHLAVEAVMGTNSPSAVAVESQGSTQELRERIDALELKLRREQIQQATVREELDRTRKIGVAPFVAQTSTPLLLRDLLEARVLGRERELDRFASILVDLGTAGGAVKEAFVVYAAEPILDQGTTAGVTAGQPVYAGRCVLGRIIRTGRWTSAVQLITNPKYSGRAQLLRESEEGVQFGAEGILRGLGNGKCQLTGLPYTEPVNVGDTVYTGGRSARFPAPMYYGRVTKAELQAGQRWRIEVEPHLNPDKIQTVSILRESLNTTRVLGQ
ncbi:MAG: rod shape-determining protein MreC [Planctomycetaceae bacterium]